MQLESADPLDADTPRSASVPDAPDEDADAFVEGDEDELLDVVEDDAPEEFPEWSCPLIGKSLRGPFLMQDEDGAPVLQVFESVRTGRQGVKRGGFLEAVAWDTTHAHLRDLVGPGRFIVEVRDPVNRMIGLAVVNIASRRPAHVPNRAVVVRPVAGARPSPESPDEQPAWLRAMVEQQERQSKALTERIDRLEVENRRLRESRERARDAELERLRRRERTDRLPAAPAPAGQLSFGFGGLREQIKAIREASRDLEEFREELGNLLGEKRQAAEEAGDDEQADFLSRLLTRVVDGEEFSEFVDDMLDSARGRGEHRGRH